MTDTQKKRNQHWVPRYYLNTFAIPETKSSKEPQIYAYSVLHSDEDKVLKVATKNMAAKNFLYSPIDEQGVRDYTFEDKQADLESMLAKLWQLLSEGYVPLIEGYRKGLAIFVANTYLRHPRQRIISRNTVDKFHAAVAKAFDEGGETLTEVRFKYGSREARVSREEFESARLRSENDYHKQFVGFVEGNMFEIAKIVLEKRWNVIVSESGQFITSDNPVCLSGPGDRKFGFGTKGASVTVPLTPRMLLVIDDNTGPGDRYVPTQKQPWEVVEPEVGLNWLTIANAYRFIFGPKDLKGVIAEVAKFSDNLRVSDPNSPDYALVDSNGEKIPLPRNALCWCGSGKKYKRCHLPLERQLQVIDYGSPSVTYERRDLDILDETGNSTQQD